jgi:hypothetical protein
MTSSIETGLTAMGSGHWPSCRPKSTLLRARKSTTEEGEMEGRSRGLCGSAHRWGRCSRWPGLKLQREDDGQRIPGLRAALALCVRERAERKCELCRVSDGIYRAEGEEEGPTRRWRGSGGGSHQSSVDPGWGGSFGKEARRRVGVPLRIQARSVEGRGKSEGRRGGGGWCTTMGRWPTGGRRKG